MVPLGDYVSNQVIILISADIEWRVIRGIYPLENINESPYGEWFSTEVQVKGKEFPIIFFHGGWGKIAAGASTQFVIDRWNPELIVNLGTCGGFLGEVEKGEIILVDRTVVYDIIEQMGDYDEHIDHYSTSIDLDWLDGDYPSTVRRTILISGDRDLMVDEVTELRSKFGAVGGDWESGAIAWVAARNGVKCLILRGVTDLVSNEGGEAYDDQSVFVEGTQEVMVELVTKLPRWLRKWNDSLSQ
jgi:adenosylhomocysteine nucleosidase